MDRIFIYTFLFLLIFGSFVSGMCNSVSFIELFNQSDVIFQGKVIDITDIVVPGTFSPSGSLIDHIYTFKINNLYKGKPIETINITYSSDLISLINDTIIETYFSIGSEALIYTSYSEKKNQYSSSSCSSPHGLERDKELTMLNNLKKIGQIDENIVLKEIEENKIIYELTLEKEGKIFGLIKTKGKVSNQFDLETGEVLKIKKPWWAFLAKGI